MIRTRASAFDVQALIAATGLTRFAFRSHYLYDIDSVNFALALKRFDTGVHQPHPPGYFLYVCLGRLFNLVFHDANTALVAMSILFSCGAVTMIYVLGHDWFDRRAALFAGLIFLFSPLAWFHGTVALIYIVEAFFSALLGHLCWRVWKGDAAFLFPAAIVTGVGAGFRPSSLLFLGPLFLFSLRDTQCGRALRAIAALVLTVSLWLIPMVRINGAQAYVSSLTSLWMTVPGQQSIFNSSVLNSVVRAVVITGVYFLCFGCAALLPFRRLTGVSANGAYANGADDRRKTMFTWVWIAPGLLFFTFVYLKFVNSGYLLILAPPVCVWLGSRAADWYESPGMPRIRKMSVIAGCAAVNAMTFIWAPVYCSYGEVRRFEAELSSIIAVLPRVTPGGKTMIVGMDSHFLGYRHAGYYLPDYLTVQYPEVRLASGRSVFTMQNQDTRVARKLDTALVQNFVFFPLPSNDSEYKSYMAAVRARFPGGDLRIVARGGHEYVTGPIGDLHFLFPSSVSSQTSASQTVATVH